MSKISLSNNLDDAKVQLKAILNERIYKKYPRLNEELFTEALDYLSGSYTGDLPLLQLFSSAHNKSLKEMANDMLQEKKQWIKQVCDIEKNRLEYLNKIEHADTIEELEKLLEQM